MNVMIVIAVFAAGLILGVVLCEATIRHLRRRLNKLRSGSSHSGLLSSVTKLIFVTTQISALVWVFTSYAIAIYATLRLEQVYTMSELSEPAIQTILGVGVLKVLENIFEHNNGPLFGSSQKEECP